MGEVTGDRAFVSLGRTPWFVWTGGLAIVFLFPMLWAAYASVAPQGGTHQAFGYGLGNYQRLFEFGSGLPQYFWNSTQISTLTVLFTLLISTFGGYAFARFSFRGKDALFLLTLAILMVPAGSLLIPLYVLLYNIGLGNSLLGVVLVLTLFQLPVCDVHDADLVRVDSARAGGVRARRWSRDVRHAPAEFCCPWCAPAS